MFNNVRKKTENFNIAKITNSIILQNEEMKNHTTFRVGGCAEYFIEPKGEKSFIDVLSYILQSNIQYFVLGGGSNIVVSDNGLKGVVLSTAGINELSVINNNDEYILHCGAGCRISSITEYCIKNSLSGLETFAGLPGSIGGAAFMNARCYEVSLSDVLCSITYIRKDTNVIEEYVYNSNDWEYKHSPFQDSDKIILSVDLKVKKGISEEICEKSKKYIQDRVDKGHFKYPSAGSVFKNNHSLGKPTGKIIDENGLKGKRLGDAQVAPWHGNFIINLGNAKAKEIKDLSDEIILVIKEKCDIMLESEILFIGEI